MIGYPQLLASNANVTSVYRSALATKLETKNHAFMTIAKNVIIVSLAPSLTSPFAEIKICLSTSFGIAAQNRESSIKKPINRKPHIMKCALHSRPLPHRSLLVGGMITHANRIKMKLMYAHAIINLKLTLDIFSGST